MVFAVDPASLVSMVTGRYDESRSPEALNARPFLRDRPPPALKIARPVPVAPPPATRASEDRDDDPGRAAVAVPRDAPLTVASVEDGDEDAEPVVVSSLDRIAREGDAVDGDQRAATDARESGKEAGR
jgi:hypothetical protein